MLLPGLLLVGAVQDGLSGYLVTASARGPEVVLLATGIVAGVALGLELAARIRIDIQVVGRSGPLSTVPVQAAASAVSAIAYTGAVRSPKRVLLASGMAALLGFMALEGLSRAGLTRPVSSGVAAVLIGVIAQLLSERQRIASLLVVVAGVFPLLPGLIIFSGMLRLSVGDTGGGLVLLVQAVTTALAIAAGVLLGELMAQGVRRDVLSQGRRNAGPRLMVPLRRRDAARAPGCRPRETHTMSQQPGADDELGYEQARDELMAVVARLESGGAGLEEQLALWERGERLAGVCERWLDGARARLTAAREAAPE